MLLFSQLKIQKEKFADFCDTEEENGDVSHDFQLGSVEKGQVINACAFDGDILEGDSNNFQEGFVIPKSTVDKTR